MLPSRYAEAQKFLTLRDGRGYNELISTADYQEFFQTASALALQTLREQHPDMPDRLLARKWIPAYRQAREAYFADVATKQNTLFKNAFETKIKSTYGALLKLAQSRSCLAKQVTLKEEQLILTHLFRVRV